MIRFIGILVVSAALTFGLLSGYFSIMQLRASSTEAKNTEVIEDSLTYNLLQISPKKDLESLEKDIRVTEFRDIDAELTGIGDIFSNVYMDYSRN